MQSLWRKRTAALLEQAGRQLNAGGETRQGRVRKAVGLHLSVLRLKLPDTGSVVKNKRA